MCSSGRSRATREPAAEHGARLHMSSCADFVLITERVFGAFFVEHGFRHVGEPAYFGEDRKAGGPLCVWYFESKECRLKFYHGDGELNLLIGRPSAPLNRIYEDTGWTYVRALVSIQTPTNHEWKDYDKQLADLLTLVQPNYSKIVEAVNR